MKVAPNKNFVTKTFSESRCERLCKRQKQKQEKIIIINVTYSRVINKKQNLLSFKLLKDKRMVI